MRGAQLKRRAQDAGATHYRRDCVASVRTGNFNEDCRRVSSLAERERESRSVCAEIHCPDWTNHQVSWRERRARCQASVEHARTFWPPASQSRGRTLAHLFETPVDSEAIYTSRCKGHHSAMTLIDVVVLLQKQRDGFIAAAPLTHKHHDSVKLFLSKLISRLIDDFFFKSSLLTSEIICIKTYSGLSWVYNTIFIIIDASKTRRGQ